MSVCKGGCPIFYETKAKEDAKNREIVAKLQQGGYVIFLRRAQAVKIGEAYRALNIPISEVWSSPFCRCKDCLKNPPTIDDRV